MKGRKEIISVLDKVKERGNKYFGMTYEEGICNALEWILGDISDEDFGYNNDKGEDHDN